jgi:threonine dehydrogenase-like Zn-dependent dehydrogenase
MKAWRVYSIGDMRLENEPIPEAKPGWVVAKVRVVQGSVTEAQMALGIYDFEKISKIIQEKAPVKLFGHEICAQVVEVGKGVTNVKARDRVASRSRMPCHQCNLCLAGHPEWCRKGPTLGMQLPGGFTEFVALPAEILVKLPDTVSDSEGACIQPSTGSAGAVAAARIQMGDTIVVLGQGCMGNYAMQIARCSGAGKLITTDVRDETLELSRQLGADHVIDARKDDPKKKIMELTNGIGADIVFDAAGGSPKAGLSGDHTLLTSFEVVRDEGKVVQIANIEGPVTLDISRLRRKGLQYLTPTGASEGLMQYVVDLVATKRLQLKPLIRHVLEGLENAPRALEMTANKAKYGIINPVQVVVSKDSPQV